MPELPRRHRRRRARARGRRPARARRRRARPPARPRRPLRRRRPRARADRRAARRGRARRHRLAVPLRRRALPRCLLARAPGRGLRAGARRGLAARQRRLRADRRGAADRARTATRCAAGWRGGRRGRGQRPRDDDRPARLHRPRRGARRAGRRSARAPPRPAASATPRRDGDEPVARERGDRVGVVGLLPRPRRAQRDRAALPERALERRLLARGSYRRPRDGQQPASGHAPHRGTRARQTVAPRSNSACAHAASKLSPVRSCTRRTFVSTGSTSRPNAKLPTAAAVYGPTPGSSVRSSGQPCSATCRAARCRLTARRLYPSPCHSRITSAGRRRRERLDRRPALEPALVPRRAAVRALARALAHGGGARGRDARPTSSVAWQGLGYNRRAVSLHRAAHAVAEHGWPDDLTELPGVGPYTAAAVGNFAFGRDVLPVDTNVRRVQERTGDELRRGRCAQALFDLGATVCLARVPRCGSCPLAEGCPSRGRRYEPLREAVAVRGLVPAAPRHRAARGRGRASAPDDAEAVASLARDGLVDARGRRRRRCRPSGARAEPRPARRDPRRGR